MGVPKGSYVLVIGSDGDPTLTVGALGEVRFEAGYYAYIGSALNSLRGRIERHLRDNKKLHWHIDYLLQNADVEDVFVIESGDDLECATALEYFEKFENIEDFGSSDCRCISHLFFSEDKGKLIETARRLGYKKYSG